MIASSKITFALAFAMTLCHEIPIALSADGNQEAIRGAKANAPTWRTVEREGGVTLRQLVDDTCGHQAPTLREFLLAEAARLNGANDANQLIQKGRAVALP